MRLPEMVRLHTVLLTGRSTSRNLIIAVEFVFEYDPYVLVWNKFVSDPALELYVLAS